MRRMLGLLVVLVGLAAGRVDAAVIFSDNFDGENGGVGALNYAGFANFTVSNGSVDLIGNGYFDYLPGNGLYIDLDGSTSDAGVLTESPALALAAGLVHALVRPRRKSDWRARYHHRQGVWQP